MRAPVPRREMTADEIAMVEALRRCRFTPASFSKRFARSLTYQVDEKLGISEAQASCLRREVTRYRRQISPAALPEAVRHLLGDEAAKLLNTGRRAS